MPHLIVEFHEPDGSTPPFMKPRNCQPTTARIVARQWVKGKPGRRARAFSDEGQPLYDIRSTPEHPEHYIFERLEAMGEQLPTQCEDCGHPRHQGLCMTDSECVCGASWQEEEGYVN
jgi:hypothetical protein